MEIIKPHAIILDLDNCFFDSTFFEQYLPTDYNSLEQWADFAPHYRDCKPNPWCVNIANTYNGDLIFMTARWDDPLVKAITYDTIKKALGHENFRLYMRPSDNFDKSHVIKRDLYIKQIKDNFIIDFAIDDDLMNSLMWLNEGIVSLQRLL